MYELLIFLIIVIWGIAICVSWVVTILYGCIAIGTGRSARPSDWVLIVLGMAGIITPLVFEGIGDDKYVIGKDGTLTQIIRPGIMTQSSYNRLTTDATVVSKMMFYDDRNLYIPFGTNIIVRIDYRYDQRADLEDTYITITKHAAKKNIDPSAALQDIVVSEAAGQLKTLSEKSASLDQNKDATTIVMDRASIVANTLQELKPIMDKYHIYPVLTDIYWNNR